MEMNLMETIILCFVLLVSLHSGSAAVPAAAPCSPVEIQKCVTTADPLLRDPNYVFPASRTDIEHVCRTWKAFLDCVNGFTEKCLSQAQKDEFNREVQGPINSVHELCTNSRYQEEYLIHAPCIKNVSSDDKRCGRQYRYLVEQVSGTSTSSKQICCSHHKFRECVLAMTRRDCDLRSGSLAASEFARRTLDKALSFLLKQCENYIPSAGDCPEAGPSSFNPVPNSLDQRAVVRNSNAPYSSGSTPSYANDLFGPSPQAGNSLDYSPHQQGLASGDSGASVTISSLFISLTTFAGAILLR